MRCIGKCKEIAWCKLKIKLTAFESNYLLDNTKKKIILYGDFNVINYLYENNIKLNNEILVYPDSTAVYFALKYLCKINYKKIVRTDLQEKLLSKLISSNKKLFFFGDEEHILERMIKKMKSDFPNILIAGFENGYSFNNKEVLQKIKFNNTDILFVGLGVGLQEKWINENFSKINSNLIIAVGGWFQFLSGNKKRASLFLRKNHFEWLYKFFVEFNRVWKRYLFGIPKFYYRVITKKIILNLTIADK